MQTFNKIGAVFALTAFLQSAVVQSQKLYPTRLTH